MLKSNLVNTICNAYMNDHISKKSALDKLSRWSNHFSWNLSVKEIQAIERKAYKQAVKELNN